MKKRDTLLSLLALGAAAVAHPRDMKTAKALGITVPQSVLARADEVIR